MFETRTERVTMMMEKSLVQRIEDYRFAYRKGSRASAMRDLLDAALRTEEEKGSAEAATSPSHGSDQSPQKEKANERAEG